MFGINRSRFARGRTNPARGPWYPVDTWQFVRCSNSEIGDLSLDASRATAVDCRRSKCHVAGVIRVSTKRVCQKKE